MFKQFQHKFITNAGFSGFLHLTVKLVWILVMETAIQRAVGTTAYGEYFSKYGITLMLLMLLDPGLNTYYLKQAATSQSNIPALLKSVLSLKLILALGYLFTLFTIALIQNENSFHVLLYLGMGLYQILLNTSTLLRSTFAAKQRFKWESLLANTDKILLILFISFFLFLPKSLESDFTIGHFVSAQLFAGILSLCITVFFLKKELPLVWFANGGYSGAIELLKKSAPFAILSFLMMAYFRIDGVLLAHWSGSEAAGIYAAGYRFVEAFIQFSALFGVILMPAFSHAIAQNKSTFNLFFTALGSLFLIATFSASIGYFAGNTIAAILYKEKIAEIGNVISLLALSFLPLSISLVSGAWITAKGWINYLNGVALIVFVITLAGNFLLIPISGTRGSASVFIAAQTFSAVALLAAVLIGLWKNHRN